MTRLSETPFVNDSAKIKDCELGRYTEIDERCRITETKLGDYSYIMQDCEVWATTIGKFVNIASHVRINATNHPHWRATQHHFTYRAADYFEGEENEVDFFNWRRENSVTIGHEVWIGHGATILPGVSIGNGAIVGSGAVVTKDAAAYSIVGGIPAKLIRERFSSDISDRMDALSWWDWDHKSLQNALNDFRSLSAEEFLFRYE